MTLLSRAIAIETALQALATLDSRRAEYEALAERVSTLAAEINEVKRVENKIQIWQGAGLMRDGDRDYLAAKVRARASLEDIAQRFEEAPVSKTLTSAKRWSQLLDALHTVEQAGAYAADQSWKAFVADECAVETAEAITGRLPPSPDNRQRLATYSAKYQDLVRRLKGVASDVQEIQNIRDQVKDLKKTYREFEFDYPPEVTAFLNGVMNQGVTLDQLTPKVLEWLREHKLLSRYIVRSRQP